MQPRFETDSLVFSPFSLTPNSSSYEMMNIWISYIVMYSNEFKTEEKQKLTKIKINCNIYIYLLKTESLDNTILELWLA